jgi:hypothetical protein
MAKKRTKKKKADTSFSFGALAGNKSGSRGGKAKGSRAGGGS